MIELTVIQDVILKVIQDMVLKVNSGTTVNYRPDVAGVEYTYLLLLLLFLSVLLGLLSIIIRQQLQINLKNRFK